jgi:hypothetical protein
MVKLMYHTFIVYAMVPCWFYHAQPDQAASFIRIPNRTIQIVPIGVILEVMPSQRRC